MNIKKIGASVATAALLTLGLAVIPAVGASAHTYGATADCQSGLTVGLDYYHATIPGTDAVPGTDPIPGAHHDAVGTPTITIDNPDYVPAVDAVATTYVQEFEYVQKNHPGQTQWHTDGWNPGKGWDKTGNSRNSTTVLVQGHDAVPSQGTPTIEVPNPAYVAAYDDAATPGTPGTPAVAEQANHLTVLEDGATLIDTSFGPSFHENWPNTDKTVAHDYDVTVTSIDGIGAFHKTLHIDACEVVVPPVTPVEGTPIITVTGPTCDAPYNTVNYSIPEGLSIAGYTGTGSVKAEDINLGYGDKSYAVDVADGFSYEGPASVSITLVEPPTEESCTPVTPEPIVLTINPVTTTQATCDAGLTYTIPVQDEHIKYALNGDVRPTPGTYSLGKGETVTISAHLIGQYSTANGGDYAPVNYSVTIVGADKLDCPVTVVTPPPASVPAKPVPAVLQLTAAAPAEVVLPTEELAHTGSNVEDFSGAGFLGGSLLLLGLGAGIVSGLRHRKAAAK